MGWIRILRPLNCVMIALGTFCGMLLVKNTNELLRLSFVAIPALSCSFFIGAGGNVLNDYYDREIDARIKPSRVLPKGGLTIKQAKAFAISLLSLGLFSVFLTFSWLAIIIALLAVILLVSYEGTFKRKGFIGNLVISILVALVFLFGGVAVNINLELNAFKPLVILATLAFLSTLSREIVKDIEDLRGDRLERNTLPLKFGTAKASFVAACTLISAVILSPLPYLLKIFDWPYLAIVILANIIFIYSISLFLKKPSLASKMIKLGMVLALFAFVINSIL